MHWYHRLVLSQSYMPYGSWLDPDGRFTNVVEQQAHAAVARDLGYRDYDDIRELAGYIKIVNPNFFSGEGRVSLHIAIPMQGITQEQLSSLRQLMSKANREARGQRGIFEFSLESGSGAARDWLVTENMQEALGWLQGRVRQLATASVNTNSLFLRREKRAQWGMSLNRNDYDSEEEYQGARYFEIGHDHPETGEEYKDGEYVIWVWSGPGGLITANRGTHGNLCGGHEYCDRHYKGRFDPIKKMISIVVPRKPDEAYMKYDIAHVPNRLIRDLTNEFGHDNKYEVF